VVNIDNGFAPRPRPVVSTTHERRGVVGRAVACSASPSSFRPAACVALALSRARGSRSDGLALAPRACGCRAPLFRPPVDSRRLHDSAPAGAVFRIAAPTFNVPVAATRRSSLRGYRAHAAAARTTCVNRRGGTGALGQPHPARGARAQPVAARTLRRSRPGPDDASAGRNDDGEPSTATARPTTPPVAYVFDTTGRGGARSVVDVHHVMPATQSSTSRSSGDSPNEAPYPILSGRRITGTFTSRDHARHAPSSRHTTMTAGCEQLGLREECGESATPTSVSRSNAVAERPRRTRLFGDRQIARPALR